jgi:Glycosyl transferase family 2
VLGQEEALIHRMSAVRRPRRAAMRPTVSVVIPCYRYGRFLPDCVRSVLGQHGVDVRVLIIDDASPDDSAEVAARLAAEDDRVEVLIHERNRGHIATYNEGLLDWAEGDYSVLLSADDLLTPDALARATCVMDARPEIGLLYGHAISWQHGTPLPAARVAQTGTNVWAGEEWLLRVCRLGHSVVASPEVVVRTSVQQRIGGYLSDLPHSGDAEMWMRFAAHAGVAYVKGVDQAYYRTHGANMTAQRVPIVDLRQRKAAYDHVFDAHGARIRELARLREHAGRRLAKEALWEACRALQRPPVDEAAVTELVEFARSAYPRASRLSESWGVRWRRAAGPGVGAALRPFLASSARRRIHSRLWWRRWEQQGI